MNPKLLISKRTKINRYLKKTIFNFCVVDAEINKLYPQNFVCIFPKDIDRFYNNVNCPFVKIFGLKQYDLALKLLHEALEEYKDDSEIKAEIEKRITILSPKPIGRPKRKVNLEVLYTLLN